VKVEVGIMGGIIVKVGVLVGGTVNVDVGIEVGEGVGVRKGVGETVGVMVGVSWVGGDGKSCVKVGSKVTEAVKVQVAEGVIVDVGKEARL